MANLRQEIEVGSTGDELVAAFTANAKNANIRVYNVEDYGAVHDGETDDTVAIQAAINACYTAKGGIVYFPCGTYIIAGAVQTDIDGLNPNSQLYIPGIANNIQDRVVIMLLGEMPIPYTIVKSSGIGNSGVILKSTITGSGVFPSVIGTVGPSGAYGELNYNYPMIKNMVIIVNHDSENGVTMGGINFIRCAHCYIDTVSVEGSCESVANIIQPTTKVIGIGVGFYLDDFPRIGRASVKRGFYYGFVLGEGVHVHNITSMRNLNGIMFLNSSHGCLIDFATIHWCTNTIIAQDDTVYGIAVGTASVNITNCSIETDEDPEWTHLSTMVLDSSNYLIGEMNCNCNATLPLTKTGGRNLFINDQSKVGKLYTWTTATRPSVINVGTIGYNSTTSKFEAYNGAAWVDLH